MTRNPDGLRKLEKYFERHIGPYWLGTVGDQYHTYGYHLGAFETTMGDYSVTLQRDINGVNKYGGYWASAVDVGMGWKASRDWLKWLTSETMRGSFPDIREIIGSTDGRVCYRWDNHSNQVTVDAGDHFRHTHIGFHRDSIFRNHTGIFLHWTRNGRVLPKPTMRPSSKPRPVVKVSPTYSTVPASAENPSFVLNPLWGLVGGGFAWIVKRRMELARENTNKNSG